jgi:hypothetical protein
MKIEAGRGTDIARQMEVVVYQPNSLAIISRYVYSRDLAGSLSGAACSMTLTSTPACSTLTKVLAGTTKWPLGRSLTEIQYDW